jgi:hypothetical protein
MATIRHHHHHIDTTTAIGGRGIDTNEGGKGRQSNNDHRRRNQGSWIPEFRKGRIRRQTAMVRRKTALGRMDPYEEVEGTVVQHAWPSSVGQDNSKHGKHASSHDDMDWLENEVTRPHGNTQKKE